MSEQKNDDLYRVLIKGGVTSPGELKDIVMMVESTGLKTVSFGSRQDILFPLDKKDEEAIEKRSKFNIDMISERSFQNIVCSYVSADIFPGTSWLKGSTYLYILEQFNYLPKFKINITDPKQRLVPLFTGQLNFIASETEDYWFLHVKLPQWEHSDYYPVLIHSWDLQKVAYQIEQVYENAPNTDELFRLVNNQVDTNSRRIENVLEIPFSLFPYYEGMNKMGLDQYWLGLYWRNNKYDIDFLKAMCDYCLDHKVGKICITPWKSFIIKGIKRESRPDLERFLGQRGINVRHSQLEMNWHLPVDDQHALDLKKFIVRNFDQNDISTYGLTFGISNDVGKRTHFAAIVIEKNRPPSIVQEFEIRPTYNVLHSKNFDPNTREYKVYAQDVDKMELPGLLMELSRDYFDQLGSPQLVKKPKSKTEESIEVEVYQCTECMTVYDPTYGDEQAGIAIGTPFENLPEDYCCPVCSSPKTGYINAVLKYS